MTTFKASALCAWACTFAASLGFGTAAMATCSPTPINNNCTSTSELTFTTPPAVFVAAKATQSAAGGWDYQYSLSVDNTAQLPFSATSWLLPVASDAQISQLQAIAYSPSGINATLTAVGTEAGLRFNIPSPYPLDMPGTNRVMDLGQITFHSTFGPDASATSAITLTGTTTTRIYNSSGVRVTETRTGITPATPSLVTIAMPGSPMALSPVPEASPGALMALGMAGTLTVARCRRKKSPQAGT